MLQMRQEVEPPALELLSTASSSTIKTEQPGSVLRAIAQKCTLITLLANFFRDLTCPRV